MSISQDDPQAFQLTARLVLREEMVPKEGLPWPGGPASLPPLPTPQSQPSPLSAQGQVELTDGLQELPFQHLVGHSSGQRELELVVDDALGLTGLDRAVEVTQLPDGMQLAWAREAKGRSRCHSSEQR